MSVGLIMSKLNHRVAKVEKEIKPKTRNIIFAHSKQEANKIKKARGIKPWDLCFVYIVGKIEKDPHSGLSDNLS